MAESTVEDCPRPLPALVDAAIIGFVLAFPHWVPMPFYSYAVVCIAVVLFSLRRRRTKLADLGLKKSNLRPATFLIGISTGVLWLALMQWGYIPIVRAIHPHQEYTDYDFIRKSWQTLAAIIAASWVVGGLYEEIVFRGFILSILRRWLGRLWLAGFLTSLLFGLYHIQQGAYGIVAAFLGSLYWTALYRKSGDNLWAVVVSHATYDTAALILIYFNRFGK
jgi:membrane protease YdiL (CAAX protease family)